jgi:hypothetical protein
MCIIRVSTEGVESTKKEHALSHSLWIETPAGNDERIAVSLVNRPKSGRADASPHDASPAVPRQI